MGDATSAVAYFDESVTFLSKVETDDLEVQIKQYLVIYNDG